MKKKSWIIEDWTGRRLFPEKTFKSFQAGWDHIYVTVPDEGDSTYDDYYVTEEKP